MPSYPIESTSRQLLARARELTRIELVDSDIEEALDRLLDSLGTEAELTEPGAREMQRRILSILCNRLRMQRDCLVHPEIERQELVRPLFLTGAGRSGSTKLHKLLAASGEFKYFPFWRQYSPSLHTGQRDEDAEPRIRDAEDFIRWFDRHAPLAKRIHAYETFEPEEETFLMDHSRFIINFMITHAHTPSYLQWAMTQDMKKQLEFLRQAIKYVQWQFHDGDTRPWLLKDPLYSGMEPLLRELFPGAIFVVTHREPGARVSSSAGLVNCMRTAYSDADRSRQAGPMMFEYMAMTAMQDLASRDAHPDIGILDIGYSELTQSAGRVAEKVYAFANLSPSDAAREAMLNWDRANVQHKYGVYRYALADCGITQARVDERFRAYNERFEKYF